MRRLRARALGLVLVTVGVTACHDGSVSATVAAAKKGPESGSGPAAHVTIVSPAYRTRATVLETTGKVQFNEEQIVRVNAPVTGRIVEVVGRPGDVVQVGHRLLVLDSADLGAAKADYAKAVSDVERASAALKLARELLEAKAIAQKEVREAQNDERKAIAERERAAARLRTLGVPEQALPDVAARADASTRVVVSAPRGGVIVERNVSSGQVVAFGQSDTPVSLFVIADLSTMWVVADIYEPDVAKVRGGQSATIRLPCCPDEPYEGKVAYISDSVDKESRTVKVRIVVPNRGRLLKNEMFVKVAIGTAVTRVLAIPTSAVHRDDGRPYVFVAKGETFERRPVTLGSDVDGFVEVTGGLSAQDRIAGDGSILLRKAAQ